MPLTPPENDYFLKAGDIVNVGIDLPDMTFAEDVATVICSEHGELTLQLCGDGFPLHMPIISGSKVLISKGEGRTLYQGIARLKNVEAQKTLTIESPRRVIVSERREYMRMDVSVPVTYSHPQSQNMAHVIAEWERLKGCNGDCHEEAVSLPAGEKYPVNLSGGGLRFKIRDCLSFGTLLHLKIALPGEKPDHIHAVGSIIRTNELLSETNQVEYHSTAMSFRMITGSDRQKLVRHILDEQRKSLIQTH